MLGPEAHQTDSPHAGLSALLCVSIKGLTYLILNDRGTVPSRNGFQQVSSPYDWNHEFNKKQESRNNEGMQSASGETSEAEAKVEVGADGKDLGSTAERASQSAELSVIGVCKQPQVLGKVPKAFLDTFQSGWSLTSEPGVVERPKSFPLIVC